MLNTTGEEARLSISFYFEDREPVKGVELIVPPERTRHARTDELDGAEIRAACRTRCGWSRASPWWSSAQDGHDPGRPLADDRGGLPGGAMSKRADFLAVDVGAESGRVFLGCFDGQRVDLREVHRFANVPVRVADGLHWDVLRIMHEVNEGLREAVREGRERRASGWIPGGWTSPSLTGTERWSPTPTITATGAPKE